MSEAIQFELPPKPSHRFLLNGKRYRVGFRGAETIWLMNQILEKESRDTQSKSLFWIRQWVREVESQDSHCVLSYLVHSRDSKVQRLAIFLRGRCGGSIGTSNIFEVAKNGDAPTRKIAVRALRRMRAWAQLADIAATEPCERIRRIAEVRESSPYASRLKTFTKNVAEIDTESSPQPLYVIPGLELDQGRKPKTASMIRMYLERIVKRLSSAVLK